MVPVSSQDPSKARLYTMFVALPHSAARDWSWDCSHSAHDPSDQVEGAGDNQCDLSKTTKDQNDLCQ
jgi:hypothetical protein